MRWILVGLGILTFVLAVVLAKEGQWWVAVPDGMFGIGIAWLAWEDLHAPATSAPALRTAPSVPEPVTAPPTPSPTPAAPPAAPKPRASVPSAKKRRKGRH